MKKQAKIKAKQIVEKMSKCQDESGFVSLNRFRHKKNAQVAVELVLETDLYSEDRDFWIEVLNQIILL